MEYGRLQPIQGVNGKESTAITKKSIKELLAEEGSFSNQQLMERATMYQPGLQQPPHMRNAMPTENVAKPAPETPAAPAAAAPVEFEPQMQAEPAAEEQAEAPAEKSRSFLGRLFGK